MEGLVMKYFVLNPAGNSPYHLASRIAMEAYANTINIENGKLAYDLREWIAMEEKKLTKD